MKSNQNTLDTHFRTLCQKMSNTADTKPEQLTKVQQTVIFTHAINQDFGLECVNRSGEPVDFPENWAQANEGVYRFNYRLKGTEGKDKEGKIVQFRFVDNRQEDGSLSVNYSVEDSEELHQSEVKYEKGKTEENSKAYRKQLQQKLKNKKNTDKPETKTQHTILQPQWRTPNFENPRQPVPIILPNQNTPTNPFHNPYTGGQFIGPDHDIFRGRGQNNPLGLGQQRYDPNDPRRPMGSRFDPIDPFGSSGIDEVPRTGGQFMGFDQFGRPFGGGQGGFGPGKFL